MFENRLAKNAKHLARWAKREGIGCYRVYDADIPEFNVAVDWYDGAARVEEYGRPKKIDPAVADRRLEDARLVTARVLGIDPADVVLRVRRRRGEREQHERFADRGAFREVREGDLVFRVNLTDYLDTGLFLDDRLLRARIRASSRDARFLNLFAHTCAATVAAAKGGARTTTSVDLSNTYLEWGRANLALNGFGADAHRAHELVRADALRWIRDMSARASRRFDLVYLAPPTHSQSKAMDADFDVQRDHVPLIRDVARLLAPGGELLFTTNLRTFALDGPALAPLEVRDISAAVTPPDFAKRPRLRAFSIRARA